MVAMGGADEDERPVQQGCMAGFLHLFDRPHILSGKRRLCHQPRRLLSSSSSGSATPSEMSMPLDRATPLPSSPEMTPPAAPRPSLQLPPLDLKDRGGAAASWRLPRLSLDSRAVVDARGKLRQRDNIRAASPAASPGMAGAPSVVARLMGLDALPYGAADEDDGQQVARGGELRRSASERVPRDPARFRFVDPSFFEKPAPPVLPQRPSSPTTEAAQAQRRSPDPAFHRAAALQRRSSHFDAREVFPEPAKRVDPSAGRGEIALCGEIDRRLRKRGIAEPARDLETLKQILEALQLKGLLRHSTPAPPLSVRNHPPPIVVMRPSSRPPQPPTSPTRRLRVQVDNARRPRSPDRAASPARSPASPARRGPQSPQRRVSPEKRHQPLKKPNTAELPSVRSRIARHAAHNQSADDDASTTFSDGGSSSSVSASASASSRWDMEQQRARLEDRGLLERCGKLLSSIEAFTSAGDAAADQQPSPVSVLDAATFLADEDSPSSSGSKRGMGRRPPSPRPVASPSFPEDDDEVVPEAWLVGPEASDPDFAYVAEVVCLSDRMRNPDDVYRTVEKRRRRGDDTWQHRRLLCGAAGEALDRWRCAHPSEPVAWLRGEELLRYVWAEVQRAMEPPAAAAAADDDLNDDQTRGAILRDLAADRRWSPSAEAADAVLQIERLLFKDLVADAICELAEADRLRRPRRKLVF
ncbi:hypothetical protein D1007_49598 [Hordeum vulgare]|nr:hypothetical protein D1007_49598 [Hordeum vulgare]